MIYLFTDFGYQGPYVGEMQALLQRRLTHQQTTNLMHDAPRFNPRASAYLLAALSQQFEYGDICLAVVDPGVGHPDRKPIWLEVDGINFVGPDNGLLSVIARRGKEVQAHEVTWRPEKLSTSFHGRDLFAPVTVKVALRERIDSEPYTVNEMVGADWPVDLDEVIYIDHFGNAITGLRGDQLMGDAKIVVNKTELSFADTFSSVAPQQAFWYVNSMGLVEIAVNQGSAAQTLDLSIGVSVTSTQRL
jgi:S-adenosylmethionine hydrolase